MKISPHHHLTYCTNIHPGESWEAVRDSLEYVLVVKQQLCPDEPFGIGLRLSATAAAQLAEPKRLKSFKMWLDVHDCYVFTMNGFPYGGFHKERVKDKVYAPDWSTRERVTYTKQLFDILVELLPEGLDGGVSTSPLSYKPWLGGGAQVEAVPKMREHIVETIHYLADLRRRTGKDLHLDLEPEPDGLIENTQEFLDFYRSIAVGEMEADVRRHFAICYDVCHFAVAYESSEQSLSALLEEGVRIGRLQISAALKANLTANRGEVRHNLEPYDEPVYLHQAALRRSDGSIDRFPDLAPALEVLDDPAYEELRTHFHVPIYADSYGLLHSTNDAIREALRYWKASLYTPHLEVETYTWDVLPDHQRLNLTDSIVRELEWVRREIAD
ncbi:metabolite traffic protein EboE [Lewinella sp. IMCC34191]|uniref:metabolite traffic protein EboE n=1 Tax=Lewinella sp. IMCC34191 TaxID=2259172 RepID=UPI000E23B09B|nr:metabolite traffic protein EboE [Lewinella sp. IMCC34191]